MTRFAIRATTKDGHSSLVTYLDDDRPMTFTVRAIAENFAQDRTAKSRLGVVYEVENYEEQGR